MSVLDASAIIHGWDEYPYAKFPKLWEWLDNEALMGQLSIPSVALDEVGMMSPDCCAWIKGSYIEVVQISSAIIRKATLYKSLIGVVDDKYHPKGVDENDLLIIASACEVGRCLVSNEARQPGDPLIPAKRKIPAVCNMAGISVPCMNFRELFMTSATPF